MKSLISLAALVFFTNIIFPIQQSHCSTVVVPMDAKLIEGTCRKTPNYNLCVSTLKADPKSATADVAGLALIMVDAVKAKATILSKEVNELLKKRPRDQSLKDCAYAYKVDLRDLIPMAHQGIAFGDPKFAEESINWISMGSTECDAAFKGSPRLIYLSNVEKDDAKVASAIVKILL